MSNYDSMTPSPIDEEKIEQATSDILKYFNISNLTRANIEEIKLELQQEFGQVDNLDEIIRRTITSRMARMSKASQNLDYDSAQSRHLNRAMRQEVTGFSTAQREVQAPDENVWTNAFTRTMLDDVEIELQDRYDERKTRDLLLQLAKQLQDKLTTWDFQINDAYVRKDLVATVNKFRADNLR